MIAPPITESPIFFIIECDSPVNIDSSHDVSPEIMIPSTGNDSPGRIIKISPMTISDALHSINDPSIVFFNALVD